jgi:hypothetical protein
MLTDTSIKYHLQDNIRTEKDFYHINFLVTVTSCSGIFEPEINCKNV